jgi:serine/threonine-protein kinase
MTCPRCATTLEDGARFCGVCGHRLEDDGSRNRLETIPQKPRAGTSGKAAAPAAPASASASAVKKVAPIAPPPAPDAYIGTTLNGRFSVETKLGEGGFGAVYQGVQLLTGRRVAIKLLHPEMTRDQNVVARFRREGQVLCSLRDAHTITTYDFDQTPDGTLFIAMELLEGRSLHDVFHEEAPIAWQRMLKVMSEMCSSLEEAHSLGIVHRDLKPENVYLEPRPGNPEFVKILDFGIAKVIRGDGSSGIAGDMSPALTATGQTLGTLEYMSPEQLMGRPLDGRSDIYGLGVVAFEMLTGRLPFPDAVGPAALISAQLKKSPPLASQVNPEGGIPPEVDQLITRMLAKDKNTRFRDAGELRREIDGILSTLASPPARAASPRSPAGSSLGVPEPRAARGAPGGGGMAAAAPGLASAPAATPVPVLTARAARGPASAALLGNGPASDHLDPPWAAGRPFGSSDDSPALAPRGTAGPVPEPRPPTHPTGPAPASPPWMWITVGAILLLALAIGTFLAMR